jgi:aarF domain-containing kinase
LIDYGQIKTISVKERRDIAEILLCLAKGESGKAEVVEKAKQSGFSTQTNNVEVLYKSCVLAFDRDDLEMTEGMGLNAYVAELGKRDQSKAIPDQFIMAVRMCVILRGVGAILGPHHEPISIANRWKQLAKRSIASYPVNDVADREKPFYQPKVVSGLVQDLPLFA